MNKAALKTIGLTILVVGVSLGLYVVAFLNWPFSMAKCPSSWVGSIERIFEPARLVERRLEHQKDVAEWRKRKGIWKANYPEDLDALFEIVEAEPGLFRIVPKSPIPFLENQGCDLLLDSGGALAISKSYSADILPVKGFLYFRVSKLPLNGQPIVEYGFERIPQNRSEQDEDSKPENVPS